MAPRTMTSQIDASIDDFAEQSLVSEPKRPVINRKVVKPAKKRTVTMKRSPATTTKTKKPAARKPLQDRTNLADETMEEETNSKTTSKPKSKKAQLEVADSPKRKPAVKPRKREASPSYMQIIPETQQPLDVSLSIEEDVDDMEVDHVERAPPQPAPRQRSASYQRTAQPYDAYTRPTSQHPRVYSREGSAALGDRRVVDSEARRKLADMSSKYEDMRLRYESLSELGPKAAESNFEKLKRATDQRAKDAGDLIASLKKDLAEARKASSGHNADNAKLSTQISTLKSAEEQAAADMRDVRRSLAEAQNEVKALTAKLDATRKAANAAAAAHQAAKAAPVSMIADGRGNAGSSNLDSSKQACLKEELYRDLTGLIINSVRRREGEDEFSCIQTGKNGTLHFHLTVNNDANAAANPKTPSGLSFEETEFAYEPFFDEGRDRDLIDILPDYLTEEICFPRLQAVKFYTKVVDSMNKKVEVVDDE